MGGEPLLNEGGALLDLGGGGCTTRQNTRMETTTGILNAGDHKKFKKHLEVSSLSIPHVISVSPLVTLRYHLTRSVR